MKQIVLFILAMMSSCIYADEFIGTWNIKPVSESKNQFPFWMEIKYPKVLIIKKSEMGYAYSFIDQFDATCEGVPMLVNNKEELILDYCGSGTKSPMNWGPVLHFKVIDGQLHGVVTSNIFLFKLVGVRQ